MTDGACARSACVAGVFVLALVPALLAGCSDDTSEPQPVLEPANIEQALLGIEDLPEGYRVAERDATGEPPSECALDPRAEPSNEASVAFEDEAGLSLVEHTVAMYDDEGAAEFLEEVRDVFATCDSPDVRVEVREVDDAGDDVAAYRMTLRDSDLPFTTDVTYMRSGDVIVAIATLSVIGPPSAALDDALLDAAVDRLERAIEIS